MSATKPGDVRYMGTQMRYYGKVTVEQIEAQGSVIVVSERHGRGRAAVEQLFATAKEAKAAYRGPGDWSNAALLASAVRRSSR